MKIKEKAVLHNRFDIKVVDAKTGKVKQTAVGFNVITNYYFNSRLTASPLSKTTDLFRYIAIGTGTGTPKVTDTALFSHLIRKEVVTLEQFMNIRLRTNKKINWKRQSATVPL